MASFLKKALPGVLPPALAANPDLNAAGMNGTVLASIVTAAASRTFPEAVSMRAVREMRATRVTRAAVLEWALRASGRRFILEVKAASPSEGLMRGTIDTDVYARTYGRFADAVSVVTEPDFFAGSFDRLADIRRKTVLPILAKDFFVKEEQILAAARAGADAVLLMLSVLSDVGYRKLAAFAQSLGLEILTEADSETDLARARRLGARLIGINNRDLRTLTVDRRRVETLLDAASKDAVIVAESGYETAADLAASSARVFLCGSAVSKAPDVSVGVRELLYGKSKVCGITRAEDAVAAAKAGAVAVGIILAERSSRKVSTQAAADLSAALRRQTEVAGLPVEIVAVADAQEVTGEVLKTLDAMQADVVQLHGGLSQVLKTAEVLRRAFPDIKTVVAVGLPTVATAHCRAALKDDVRKIEAAFKAGLIDRVALDHAAGGTGSGFDRDLLPLFATLPRVTLAGGLTPENVIDLQRAALSAGLRLSGFDFNSGVEDAPGVKSAEKIGRAFAAVAGRRY